MARKTKYSEYYKQYQRKVSALRKQGIELLNSDVFQTEKTLRKWGVSGKDLARTTRYLKKQLKTLAKHEAVDVATGEILTVGELKKIKASERAKRGAKTRKLNKEAEKEFWTTDKNIHLNTPQLGDIVYNNVLEDFISKISSPVPIRTEYGSRRLDENVKGSELGQSYLLKLWFDALKEDGAKKLGERIQENADRFEGDIFVVLNTSRGTDLYTAMHHAARIIKGKPLSDEDRKMLADEQDLMSSWDVNDQYYE